MDIGQFPKVFLRCPYVGYGSFLSVVSWKCDAFKAFPDLFVLYNIVFEERGGSLFSGGNHNIKVSIDPVHLIAKQADQGRIACKRSYQQGRAEGDRRNNQKHPALLF